MLDNAAALPESARDATTRWLAFLEAVTLGAVQGLKDHDRWLLARGLLARKLAGRRKHSKLPGLIELVLARPLVSAGMVAAELGVTARGAQELVAELRGEYPGHNVMAQVGLSTAKLTSASASMVPPRRQNSPRRFHSAAYWSGSAPVSAPMCWGPIRFS